MSIVVDQPAEHVLTIGINRPEARNAIDGPTARALAEEFRAFDDDPDMNVAVLYGLDGVFCAGADLKQIGSGNGNRVEIDMSKDGPLGPTRMLLTNPSSPRSRVMPSPAGSNLRCGATCASRRPMPCSASTAGDGVCRLSTAARFDSPA